MPFLPPNQQCQSTEGTQVSRYQKGKTNLDFTEARDSEWQWNQLGRMQVCTTLQTDNQNNTHHSVFYRPDALPAAQPTASSKAIAQCFLLIAVTASTASRQCESTACSKNVAATAAGAVAHWS